MYFTARANADRLKALQRVYVGLYVPRCAHRWARCAGVQVRRARAVSIPGNRLIFFTRLPLRRHAVTTPADARSIIPNGSTVTVAL